MLFFSNLPLVTVGLRLEIVFKLSHKNCGFFLDLRELRPEKINLRACKELYETPLLIKMILLETTYLIEVILT